MHPELSLLFPESHPLEVFETVDDNWLYWKIKKKQQITTIEGIKWTSDTHAQGLNTLQVRMGTHTHTHTPHTGTHTPTLSSVLKAFPMLMLQHT